MCSISLKLTTDFNFSPLLSSDDVNFIWSSLKTTIFSRMNLYIPKVRIRRQQYPCWFTPELRQLSKCARTLRKIFKHPSAHQQQKLSQLEDKLRDKILIAKTSHEANLIPSQVQFSTLFASSDFDRASLFNKFFPLCLYNQLILSPTN